MVGHPFIRGNQQKTNIATECSGVVIKKECKDEEEPESDVTSAEESDGRFICEFCDSKSNNLENFESKEELLSHCLKCHPTACLGCFEMFASSEDLRQHLEMSPHEPPVCRRCCLSFATPNAKSKHVCPNRSDSSCEKTAGSTSVVKPLAEVKKEPRGTEDMSGDEEDSFSYESDDVLEEKYVPSEMSDEEEDDGSSDDEDYSTQTNMRISKAGRPSGKDVVLTCMHCPFATTGYERQPSLYKLRNHTVAAHPNVCSICFEDFDNAEALAEHQESMKHRVWSCLPCGQFFWWRGTYRRHLVSHHPDQCPICCPECPARFLVRRQLQRHMRKQHGSGKSVDLSKERESLLPPLNICPVCDYSTITSYAIMMHMYEKHPEPNQLPNLKCDKCQIGFNQPNLFGKHIRDKHFDDPEYQKLFRKLVESYSFCFECEPCHKTYKSRGKFMQHVHVVHRSSIPHQCSICSCGYLDPIDLRMHEYRDHKHSSPYFCDHCNSSFKKLTRLLHHLHKVHKLTTMPQMYCYIHKMGFCDMDKAFVHFAYNCQNKKKQTSYCVPRPCEICGRVLSSKWIYQAHVASHAADRPFVCKVCGKGYVTALHLKAHEEVHSTKYQCSVCSRTFHCASFLKRHAIVHTGEKPFECSICGLRVSQNSALKRHMDKVHPGGIKGNPRSTKSRKCRVLSKTMEAAKQQSDESASVKIDTKLLKADLKTKPRAIPPAGSRSRKRRRKPPSSEEESELDENGSSHVPLLVTLGSKAQRKAEATNKPRKKRKRKSKAWSRALRSSSDEEKKADHSESDDEDDKPYEPKSEELPVAGRRRSSRLKS